MAAKVPVRHVGGPSDGRLRETLFPGAVDEEAFAYLGGIGVRSTLRYAVQLLTPAKVLVKTNGRETISKDDIEEIDSLFYDAKASAKLLIEQQASYLK